MSEASQITPGNFASGGGSISASPLHSIDAVRFLTALWRGRTAILCATAASLFLGGLFLLFAPRQFTAVTEILIEPMDLRAVANELTPSDQASDGVVFQVESQARVLTSDSVLRRVVKLEGLDRDPEFASGPSSLRKLADGLINWFGLHEQAVTDRTLAALNSLKRHVKVKRAERTYVVDVSVTSIDREKAARLANAIAQAYLAEQTDVRSTAARQVSQSLSARLKELQDRVREAEDRAEAFKAHNNIVGASGQLVNEQQLSELNKTLAVAQYRTAEAKARFEEVQRLRATSDIGAFPEAVQSATISVLRSQYAEIMRREAEQLTTLGPRHPAVIEIQAQAERLRRMINEEINRIAVSAQSEYESAKANEDALRQNLNTLKHTAIDTNEAMVTLRELEREVQANRAVYEAFLVRARETAEQERVDTKNIRIITKADLPLSRTWPPSNLLVAFGSLFLGFVAGGGIVIMRAPDLTGYLTGRAAARKQQAAAGSSAVPILAHLPRLDKMHGLPEIEDPNSRIATEMRKVHEVVLASHKKRSNPSVLVIAWHNEADASAVALNLAAVAALNGRVLLIDADLELRTLSAIDADQNEAGLVDVAIGRRHLSDVIVRDPETNINVLPFVSPKSCRDREIEDQDIRVAFAQTQDFEMVIVAAISCNHDPTGCFFAGLVDHIVLVASADEARKDSVDETITRFGLDARKIRGAVLTGTDAVRAFAHTSGS